MSKHWRVLNEGELMQDGDELVNGSISIFYFHDMERHVHAKEYIRRYEKDATRPIRKSKRSKWHRVEDELPNTKRDVLIKCDGKHTALAWYSTINGIWNKYTGNGTITHWRELPKFKPERDA